MVPLRKSMEVRRTLNTANFVEEKYSNARKTISFDFVRYKIKLKSLSLM